MNHSHRTIFVISLSPRKVVLSGILLSGLAALLLWNKESAATYAPVPTEGPPELGLVPRDSFLVAHIKVSGLMSKELVRSLLALLPNEGKSKKGDLGVEELGSRLVDIEGVAYLAGEDHQVAVVSTRKAFDRKAVTTALVPRAIEHTVGSKKIHVEQGKPRSKDKFREDFPKDAGKEGAFQKEDIKDKGGRDKDLPFRRKAPAVAFLGERTYVTGDAASVLHFLETADKPDEKHPLHPFLSKAGRHHLTVALVVPEEIGRMMRRNAQRSLLEELEFSPVLAMLSANIRPLVEVRSSLFTADIGEDSRIEGTVTFPDAKTAGKAQDACRYTLQTLKGSIVLLEDELAETLGGAEKLDDTKLSALIARLKEALNNAEVKAVGSTVKISLAVRTDMESYKAAMTEMGPTLQAAANRAAARNNLQQLALALITCADENNGQMLPSIVYSKDGKPLYSWRVALLPHIGHAELYRKLRLDEPWDSPFNKPLLAKMPKVFEMPGVKTPEGKTFFQVFEGSGTLSGRDQQTRYPVSFTDGTSWTILIVEAADAVHWAAPVDVPFAPQLSPLKLIGKHHGKGTLTAMADGSVRMIPPTVTEEDLRAAITPSGGEVIGASWDIWGEGRGRRGYKDKVGYKDKAKRVDEKLKDKK